MEQSANRAFSHSNSSNVDDGKRVTFKDSENDDLFGSTECRNSVTPTPTHSQVSTPMGNLGDDEYKTLVDNLVNKFKLPPMRTRPGILQYINRKRVSAMVDGNYDEAEKFDNYLHIYSIAISYEQKKNKEDEEIENLFMRWNNLKAEEQKINDYYNRKIKELNDECNYKTEILEKQHDEEYQQFLARWQNPEFLRQYNKPSTKLLQLREMEKNMAVARMYSKAKEMKGIADDQQARDTRGAQARITKDMYDERCKILEKQEMQRNSILSYKMKKTSQYELEKAAKLKPIHAAIASIKAKRSPASRQSHLPPLKPVHGNDLMTAMIHSPRTYERLSHFRSEKKAVHLEVKGLDESALQNMRRPPRNIVQSATSTARSNISTKKSGKGPIKKPHNSKLLPELQNPETRPETVEQVETHETESNEEEHVETQEITGNEEPQEEERVETQE